MRKKLKSFVAALTTVVMVLSMTAFVSAASDTKSGIVENVDYGYSYSWEYYVADDVLKIYASTTNLVINWYDLSSDVYDYFTSNTLVEIDVSDLFRGEYWWHRGYMEIYGHNCPSGKLSIIGDSLESFDRFLFCGFMTLEEVTFDECTTLSYIELNNCGITSVDIFEGVDTPELHFVSCNDLVDAVIPQGIRYALFESCENVTTIQTPMYFQLLDAWDLPNLTDLDITDSIDWCYLTDVGLTDVTVPGDCLDFRINSESLETATIESGFNYIRRDMFKLCTNLSSVSIPDGVTLISYSAFGFCYNLSHIELPSSVNTISAGAFIGSGIESINIPDGVTRIEYATFRGCENLSTVSIPSSVTTIEETAFDFCDALSDVYFDGSKTEWEAITIHCRETDSVSEMSIYDVFGDAEIHFGDFIVTQPEDYEGPIGSNAVFNVIPEGDLDDYIYQWQYFRTEDWIDLTVESATTPTLEIPITEESADWLVRCVVRDVTGRPSFSNSAAIIATESTLRIIDQSDVYYGMPGEMAELYVNAEGEGLKYQWQVLKNGVWTNCSIKDGAKTPMLILEIKESRDGSQYRCVITDKYGSSVTSDVATLYMTKLFVIESQPEDCSGYAGDIADFHIEVYGEGVKYQWQILKNGTWTNCSINDGAKTDTLTLLIKDSRDGSVYHCVVTNKYGETMISDEVTLSVLKPLSIKTQPEDFSGATGETAVFHVEAQGEGLKYQWQVYKNGAWTNCSMNDGAKTDTLSLEIKESRNGCKYHCIVSDMNGDSVTSKEVTLTMKNQLVLVNSPENEILAFRGTYVDFTIEAHGDGLKYQWQVFKNGTWTNCSVNDGAKTDTMTLEAKMSRDGLKYHCVVTDKYGQTETSKDITLYVSEMTVIERGVGSPDVTSPDITNCVASDCFEDTETIEAPEAEAASEVLEVSEVVEIEEVIETETVTEVD